MKHIITGLILTFTPLLAHAVEDSSPVKFFPIDRSGRPSAKPAPGVVTRPQLRSDSNAMNGGFMRIDRQMSAPVPLQHAVIVPQVNRNISGSDDPRIIRGAEPITAVTSPAESAQPAANSTLVSSNPILSLFNSTGAERAPSFRDTLLGRSTALKPAAPLSTTASSKLQHSWPVPVSSTQEISSGFGLRNDPLNHNPRFHGGLDIAAATGTPVLASANGQITKVGTDGAYGKSITIQNDDGSESKYGHLSGQNVSVGQKVKTGQTIGAVGATGRVTGAHLDYRISQNGVNLDPLKILALPGDVPVSTTEDVHEPITNAAATKPRLNANQQKLIVVR